MNINQTVDLLVHQTLDISVGMFAPELVLSATIVALLLFRLFNAENIIPSYFVALLGALLAFTSAFVQFYYIMNAQAVESISIFSGMLVVDGLTVFFRLLLLLFLILVTALTVLSGIPDDEDSPDFYTLLFGSMVGMLMMVSTNHLLMMFLAMEMASVPSYVMVGFLKGRRTSSEASLKFVIYGAGAAGVMLYGISLLAGITGTAELPELAKHLSMIVQTETGLGDPIARAVMIATVLVLVGFAFKLSAVPFHFWCPDAFEGAAAEVAGYLSVASKAAAFGMLIRLLMALIGDGTGQMNGLFVALGIGIGVIACITTTFGNLAAYAQSNIKRLLAYSTIAHAGYMLMAISALVVVLSSNAAGVLERGELATRCIEGLLYYLAVYLFMNLGAFAIVALIRNEIFSEELDDYAGLSHQAPVLCACMLVCIFSLIGLPPFGGFIGKFMIFSSLYQASSLHWFMWVILIIGGMNTVFSLFYYLRVLKVMFLEERPETARRVSIGFNPLAYVVLISIPVLVMGIFIQPVSVTANQVAAVLFQQ